VKVKKSPTYIQVRLPLDLVEIIDDIRGLVPRETFVRETLREHLTPPKKPTTKRPTRNRRYT